MHIRLACNGDGKRLGSVAFAALCDAYKAAQSYSSRVVCCSVTLSDVSGSLLSNIDAKMKAKNDHWVMKKLIYFEL